jgi:hypothetical protein
MTLELSHVVAIATACLFVGGQLAILAQVVRSNRDQGRRLGALERAEAKRAGAAAARRERVLTNPTGVPEREGTIDR